MEYVMVPVPEEIVDDVLAYLGWGLAQKRVTVDNPKALEEVVAAADEHSRRLLRLIAEDTLAERLTTLRAAATELGVTTREVVGLAGELNFDVTRAGGPQYTLIGRADHRPIEEGVKENDHRLLVMAEGIAKLIIDEWDVR